ncbi:MAG: ABC transporter substrate-binding protein, partial [Proteobacteria bacterium]|nr:ABC transporter substrate-binding protein [Pseudomonadota bacterium]
LQIDTPIFTVIAWNPNGPVTGDARFRRAMTHLIPRGALLRAGTGHLGDLVSAPILRSHPGYNRRLLVPNYDPQKADTILNELGYKRTPEEGFRRNPEGQALEIKLLVRNSAGSGLLRKVLDDGFRALGIKLKFIDESEGVPDGLLTGIMGSWPDSDLGPWLNSRQSESIWPWRYQDAKLDEALEAYARSLTEASPNFGLLEKVHELVYKLEPFSVLMQHRVCLDAQWPEKRLPPGEITLRDPEWFRNFIGL